jgi:heptosyltransferase-2
MQQPGMPYPNAQIDYLVYESTTPVLEAIPTSTILNKKTPKSKREFLNLALDIRSEKVRYFNRRLF